MKLTFNTLPKNSRGENIPIVVGGLISLGFIASDEVSTMTLKIVEKKIENGIITIILSDSLKTEEQQRRQYFRLSTLDEMQKNAENIYFQNKMSIIVTQFNETGETIKYDTKLINLSGGGALCAFYELMPRINNMLNLVIECGENLKIKATGKVARIERKEYEGKPAFMIGIAFLEINEKDREQIINFVLDQQNNQKSQ
ncbi:MAG: PilZ domain-containing protein [Candidatus Wallbacteria bacterium]